VAEEWTILSPVAKRPAMITEAQTYALGRSIEGVRVGLRVDFWWRSFEIIVDEWAKLLEADGARPLTTTKTLAEGDPRQFNPNDLRTDIDEWSRLVDCGLAGLGN
jgi:hypothetical protein